jgi:multiple sugar transport system ATP-binding protein
MSVERNIGFGLRTSALSAPEKVARIAEAAQILGLTDLLQRRPSELSGGQRQRVAIGRAMVRDPAVFLFDEPLSNLDAQLRAQMRLEIKKLHQRLKRTIVFVTHDQIEAMTLADRIVIMKDGLIQQVGTPDDVYHRPANLFVARFIGSPAMNVLPGEITADGLIVDGLPTLAAPGAGKVSLGLRPDHLLVDGPGAIRLAAAVRVVEPLGPDALVYAQLGAHEIAAKATGRRVPKPGERVTLAADPANLHLFDAATGDAIRHGL